MGLQPLHIFYFFSVGIEFGDQNDVYGRQILRSNVDPLARRVKGLMSFVYLWNPQVISQINY